MKSLLFLLLSIFSLLSTNTTAQNTIQNKKLNPGIENEVSTIILIRHAEKAEAHSKDPSLSDIGKQRAEALVQLFKDTPIALFYTTPYKRTTETITPIAKANGKEALTYNPSDKNSIAEMILAGKGKRMLIAGHSNTIPQMVNTLIGKNEFTTLDENDYGKLFIVVFKGKELIDYSVLNY
ncbi:SixA phosphatase family protein [Flavobacterium tegetincola]|uniref:SixA phosphatase family protein n=1 Tax=Flavobacterium tegetincola TaxID=150172 RepID=UPI0006852367|nr:phosphoglycerate mutase family protein [Flavobacterium tegetincola]